MNGALRAEAYVSSVAAPGRSLRCMTRLFLAVTIWHGCEALKDVADTNQVTVWGTGLGRTANLCRPSR